MGLGHATVVPKFAPVEDNNQEKAPVFLKTFYTFTCLKKSRLSNNHIELKT
jgi:hypothetical protein